MSEDFTIEEAAAKLRVSPSTVKREIAEGKLVPTRYRGCTRIAPQDLEEYRKKCRSAGTAGDGKSASEASSQKSADHFGVIATLPNLNAALAKGSKIVALDERRRTRSRKRLTAG